MCIAVVIKFSGTKDCKLLIRSNYIATAGFHTQFKGDAIIWGFVGMSCKYHYLGG